jgi:hypothetical protein
MKRLLIPALLFLSVFTKAPAQPASLSGSVIGGAGLELELITYADYISNKEIVLARHTIGSDGLFKLEPEPDCTMPAFLKIGKQKAEILIEPGKIYNLKIAGLLSKEMRGQDIAHFQVPALQIEILNPWRFELNGLYQEFLDFHHNFLADNAMALFRQHNKKAASEYISAVYDRFPGINNVWFNNMLAYTIAEIKLMARAMQREDIGLQYLANDEILYNHMVYMDFFNHYFDKYLLTAHSYSRSTIHEAMKSAHPYAAMLEMLGKDPLLQNEQLRELVLIKSMLDLSRTAGFSNEDIIKLLQELKDKSIYNENRLIANNLTELLLDR